MVFNLEVDGQHVYSVAGNGLLVHNACNPLRENMKANGTVFEAGEQAGHIVPKKGWAWGGDERQAVIKNVTDAGLIHDVANGFKATAGHLGTHKKTYVKDLIEEMQNRVSVEEIKEGMSNMLKKILAEDYT